MAEIYKIVMLGPLGSGKGTQADMLAARFKIPKISTGDIFRAEITAASELGQKVKKIIEAGQLVPDELTNEVIAQRIAQSNARNGFILDGYPRGLRQAQALDKITDLTHVLEIEISDKEAISRIGGRRSCECGAVYHLKYNPPQEDELCDKCERKLFIRDDDKPEAIKKRLEIYHNETEPLVKFYQEKGILLKIDGEPAIPEVSQEIIEKLNLTSSD